MAGSDGRSMSTAMDDLIAPTRAAARGPRCSATKRVAPIEEINIDAEFEAVAIARTDFEAVWKRAS